MIDDYEHIEAALADAVLAGGLPTGYYRTADAALRRLRAELEHLRSRRPVVCATCDAMGYVHKSGDGTVPATWSDTLHKMKSASIEPCAECVRCTDCGHDGCGPGVRWER